MHCLGWLFNDTCKHRTEVTTSTPSFPSLLACTMQNLWLLQGEKSEDYQGSSYTVMILAVTFITWVAYEPDLYSRYSLVVSRRSGRFLVSKMVTPPFFQHLSRMSQLMTFLWPIDQKFESFVLLYIWKTFEEYLKSGESSWIFTVMVAWALNNACLRLYVLLSLWFLAIWHTNTSAWPSFRWSKKVSWGLIGRGAVATGVAREGRHFVMPVSEN